MDTVASLSAPARIPPPAWTDSFPGRPSGVAEVRAQARAFLARSRVPPALYEDTLLVVSELVTNAVRHTGGPGNVRLSSDASGIAVTVSDTSRLLPVPRQAEPGVATSGLGLGLVAAAALADAERAMAPVLDHAFAALTPDERATLV
ncbi:ATP-binding protein, partial [Kitasatospora sp. NPDC002965]|uniref:ATP-binding protein n=1 Tax=Kitasatospora sp. NPDC002965 TaxID=3154775 RepID=UPI0033BD0FC7